MIRVVLDSNVFVSALLFGGNPRRIIHLAEAGFVRVCVSHSIQEEVERVLRTKFHWSSARLAATTRYLWTLASRIESRSAVHHCSDPDDNRVLECALDGDASWIVTGDQHLLVMHPHQGIAIVTPRQFLDQRPWLAP